MDKNLQGLHKRVNKIIKGEITCLGLPWSGLSRMSQALLPGTITLFCGDPTSSKSYAMTQQVLYSLSEGYRVAYYDLEEDLEYYLMRILGQKAGISGVVNYEWIAGNPDIIRQLLKKHEELLSEMTQYIWNTKDYAPTLSNIIEFIRLRAIEGCRLIIIDPITLALHETKQTWTEEQLFINQVKQIIKAYGVSVVLVTHPKGGRKGIDPNMETLAGSQSYPRLCHTIFWLELHQYKVSNVHTPCGTSEQTHNRTIHLLKCRNGTAPGLRVAMDFCSDTLTLRELGGIVKKEKGNT